MKVIHYIYYAAIEKLFNDQIIWLESSTVKHFFSCRTSYYVFSFILKNENTINNIYKIIDTIFLKQLNYDHEKKFDDWLYLIYDD